MQIGPAFQIYHFRKTATPPWGDLPVAEGGKVKKGPRL